MSQRGLRPDAWTRAALAPPRAHGAPLSKAELKTEPEDFRVEEQLSFDPSGQGPHWLLRVEKRATNTPWVATELARREADSLKSKQLEPEHLLMGLALVADAVEDGCLRDAGLTASRTRSALRAEPAVAGA